MPRSQKTPGQYASKNGLRSRKFSIVIHDVRPGSKDTLREEISRISPDWYLIAEEEYNHQDGSHIHLFIKYQNSKAKSAVLGFIQGLNLGGRVQCDVGRGDFDQCKMYLTDPSKIKNIDCSVIEDVKSKSLSLVERYPDRAFKCPKCDRRHYVPELSEEWDPLVPPSADGYTLCGDCWSSDINRRVQEYLRSQDD